MTKDSTSHKDMFLFAKELARKAGDHAHEKQSSVMVGHKNSDVRNVVTNVDLEIDQMLQKAIIEKYPNHAIYSEESDGVDQDTEYQWALDPIDGTSNYARGIPHYAASISVIRDGEILIGVVYNPATNECFTVDSGGAVMLNEESIQASGVTGLKYAYVNLQVGSKVEDRKWGGEMKTSLLSFAKKSRSLGASALDLCFVASGRMDVVVYGTFSTLDVAGSIKILRASGGEIYNYKTRTPVEISDTPQRIIATATPELLEDFFQKIPY